MNLLKVGEVANLLRVSQRTIWKWVSIGELPQPIRKGRKWTRWVESDILAHVKKLQAIAKPR